jgi:hypothetical protein
VQEDNPDAIGKGIRDFVNRLELNQPALP